ncbi:MULTISPECIES: nicotinate phosphoribosyltransferase [unclassified Francisella]|uniref:nicotinate phosphoribosyltransferase n=1 Tax=unclassified Francisella TaxID=2610885 RepID=UPI002E30AB0C|nr:MULTISPECIES: nicotinate phosphoribosyltransferase [unclassified Francisella]MED7819259.1 nicotinate phosphoribosyltransferase [Francisella sp. 19S2-4]MED7830048.1 nicotinate phosphoribosyltransferase [Francisella sp. 19S2-10]
MTEHEFILKKSGKIARLTDKTFQLDPKISTGIYSAKYFIKTQKILQNSSDIVLIQFFQRHDQVILCGIDESLALIKKFASNYHTLEIKALNDGDKISAFEPVLTIKGKYKDFGLLEGIIDGILARRTSLATNAYRYTKLLKQNQEIIFMGDREDIFLTQPGDGYAVNIGGITKVATDAMGLWTGQAGVGTMPHALIQSFNGNLINACQAYVNAFPDEPLIALVDYNNDVIADSLAVAEKFGNKLFAVRVDTSPNITDKYFLKNKDQIDDPNNKGVSPKLIKALRKSFDQQGFEHVKIIASGNFDYNKVKKFNDENIPVDIYGIGSSLLKVNIGFTGDCVELNNTPQAKVGRKKINSDRLVLVN